MQSILFFLTAVSLSASAAAQPPADVGETRDADWHNRQQLHILSLDAGEGWRRTASGLAWRRVSEERPEAPRPSPDDSVTIHYVGTFLDGREFDSSRARGEPATFPLPRLIRGWQDGVPLMRVGERFEFAIPWQLAYGAEGRRTIPGGATLLFDIELLGIGEPPR